MSVVNLNISIDISRYTCVYTINDECSIMKFMNIFLIKRSLLSMFVIIL